MPDYLVIVYPAPLKRDPNVYSASTARLPKVKRITAPSAASAAESADVQAGEAADVIEAGQVERFQRADKPQLNRVGGDE